MVSSPFIGRLIETAASAATARLAVVYPCESSALRAAIDIQQRGIAQVTLVGPADRIASICDSERLELTGLDVVDTPDDPIESADCAIELAARGSVSVLMKGSLHTDDLLGRVVRREAGMRGPRRLSHVFVFDIPSRAKPLLVTDCVVNIAPDLQAKRDIAQNAIDLAHGIGIALPKMAVLSATESVNPSVASSVDAAALSKMAQRGQIVGAIVDGPLGFDNAYSARAAETKGIGSSVCGDPDILLVPSLDAGNSLYKCLVYVGQAECAGVVLGAKVPVVVTSRADSVLSRVGSACLGIALSDPTRRVTTSVEQGQAA